MALPNRLNVSIPREIDPLTPIHLAGGGGVSDEKMLDVRAFLALRQLVALTEGDWIPRPRWRSEFRILPGHSDFAFRRGPTSLLGLLEGPEHRVCLGRLVKAGRPFLVLALVDANDQRVSVHLVDRLVDRVFAPLADALEVQELRVRRRVEGDDLPPIRRA